MPNLINLLSRKDMVLLLEVIQASLLCRSEDDLVAVIERIRGLIPYGTSSSMLAVKGANGLLEYCRPLNVNYPAGLLEEYSKREFAKIDPLVQSHFANFRLQYWVDIINRQAPPKDLADFADDFGLTKARKGAGYIHGFRDLKGYEGSVFSFYGLNRSKRTEALLTIIVPHLHEALRRILALTKNYNPLSAKELEVLRWLKEGKSSWDISVILNISERTVKFHIHNIMQKLNVMNRTHAVAVAIESGLIDIE